MAKKYLYKGTLAAICAAIVAGAIIREYPRYAVVQVAKEAVSAHMKDPSSVQFKNTRAHYFGSGYMVCGEVNAKNAFGAYAGFSLFMYNASDNSVILEDKNTSEPLRRGIQLMCKDATPVEAEAALKKFEATNPR